MNTMPKNEVTALILASIPGVLGFIGIGHMYLGYVRRGIVLLVVGFVFGVIILIAFSVIFLVALIPFVILLVWSILNVRKLYYEYNNALNSADHPS